VRAGDRDLEHQAASTDGPCVAPHHLGHAFLTWSTEIGDPTCRGPLKKTIFSFKSARIYGSR
ncbi:MAG: hypothetical protein AABZ44_04800, partial [Elusimicrobiota bacterium]